MTLKEKVCLIIQENENITVSNYKSKDFYNFVEEELVPFCINNKNKQKDDNFFIKKMEDVVIKLIEAIE